MSLFGSMACGIGALLALDRHDRPGDLAATGLLLGSLLFSDVGIAFVAAVALELALSRDRLRRAYVVAAPTFLWLVWYAGWGHNANTHISFRNLANLTDYVPDGVATSLASLVGLSADWATTRARPSTGAAHSSCWGSRCSPGACTCSGGRRIACSPRSRCCSGFGRSPL